MKFVLILLLVSFTTTKSQSTDEILNRCQLRGNYLSCNGFQYSYIPYKDELNQTTRMYVAGNFSEVVIDPNYTNLTSVYIRSKNLEKFQLHDYVAFTQIRSIYASNSEQELKLNFTGAEKLTRLSWLYIRDNKNLTYSCDNLRSSNLTGLSLADNKLDNFEFSCLPLNIKRLGLYRNEVSTFRSLDLIKNFSSLQHLYLDEYGPIKRLDFNNLPISLTDLRIYNTEISELDGCEALKKMSRLSYLILSNNNLPSFNFTCLPRSLYASLNLRRNQISTISDESCTFLSKHPRIRWLYLDSNKLNEFDVKCISDKIYYLDLRDNNIRNLNLSSNCDYMRNLTRLDTVHLQSNNLEEFDFKCLPKSVSQIWLNNNNISNIINLSELTHSSSIWVRIHDNPIQCTCSLFRDYVQLLETKNVTFQASSGKYISCSNTDSDLAEYPWSNNVTAMKLYDNSALNCLTAGEDDDAAKIKEAIQRFIAHIIRFFSNFFRSRHD